MPTIAEYIAQARGGVGNWWYGAPATYGSPVPNDTAWGGFPMAAGNASPGVASFAPYMDAAAATNMTGYANFGQNTSSYTGAEAPVINQGSGGLGGWLSNGQNLGTVIQGFGTLANAYLGFQQLKNAKANLAFQKDAFNTNLINSTQNYNTSLEDRIRGRTSAYEGKEADVQAYLAKHSLKPPAKK